MTDMYEFCVEWPSTFAQSVIVTGDFDQWSRSLSLLRSSTDDRFTGTIKVPYGCPTRYKFIVDGEWKVKQEEPKELSPEGFLNNVCYVPLKSPLEDLDKPKPSVGENGTSIPAGDGNTGAEVDTGTVQLNVSPGQSVKETTITTEVATETTSSQPPLDMPTDTPPPATSDTPTTSPANDAITNPESDVTQTPNSPLAPIVPIPIVPVNAKENCTIDPTQVTFNEDNIGTFVGIKPPLKDNDEKREKEVKGEGEVRPPPELSVTSPPATEAPVEPRAEVVKEQTPEAAPVQEETPTPTHEEVVKEGQMLEAAPAKGKAPAEAPEPAFEVGTEEDVPKSENQAEPKKEEEPEKEAEPLPEASSATPTPDAEATSKTPSKFIEGAKEHTRTTSDTSTAVKPAASPATSSTAPGTTLAESIASGSSAQGNKKNSEPEHTSSPGAASGRDTNEFGVKEGKGSMRNGKKRTSSIFGSLRKLFHHEKGKKTNRSS